MRRAAWALALAVAAAPPALAAAGFSQPVLSEAKGGPAKSVFKPGTDKVFLRAKVSGATTSNKAKAEWIAVKTAVAPPNYKIDSYEMRLSKEANEVTFSMSRPNAGWPEGEYRVDVFLDGKPVAQVPFKIAK